MSSDGVEQRAGSIGGGHFSIIFVVGGVCVF